MDSERVDFIDGIVIKAGYLTEDIEDLYNYLQTVIPDKKDKNYVLQRLMKEGILFDGYPTPDDFIESRNLYKKLFDFDITPYVVDNILNYGDENLGFSYIISSSIIDEKIKTAPYIIINENKDIDKYIRKDELLRLVIKKGDLIKRRNGSSIFVYDGKKTMALIDSINESDYKDIPKNIMTQFPITYYAAFPGIYGEKKNPIVYHTLVLAENGEKFYETKTLPGFEQDSQIRTWIDIKKNKDEIMKNVRIIEDTCVGSWFIYHDVDGDKKIALTNEFNPDYGIEYDKLINSSKGWLNFDIGENSLAVSYNHRVYGADLYMSFQSS